MIWFFGMSVLGGVLGGALGVGLVVLLLGTGHSPDIFASAALGAGGVCLGWVVGGMIAARRAV